MTSKNRAQKAKVNAVVHGKNEPIRILQYIGSLNIGGSQTMIMNVYRNIDRKKIQFDFIIDRKNEKHFAKEIESLGGRVYVFDEYFNGKNYFKFKRQWTDFFKSHPEYKIIHCHVRSVASIVLKIAKKNGLKTICHSHSISNGKGMKGAAKRLLQKKIKNCSDYYFACSRKAAEWLFGLKIANSKDCIILNNAIEADKYCFNQKYRHEIRRAYSIDDGVYLVGHVGRFEKEKNHEFIIELAKAVNDVGIKFMLCGDGSLKPSIQERINKEGLNDRIIFVAETDDICRYYSAFDFFIFPSLYEGLGIVLIEAQYSGLNCLVSPNVPKEAKISNNFKVKELSVAKWAKEIGLKTIEKNREKVRLLSDAEKYDVRRTAKILEQFYLRAIRKDDVIC